MWDQSASFPVFRLEFVDNNRKWLQACKQWRPRRRCCSSSRRSKSVTAACHRAVARVDCRFLKQWKSFCCWCEDRWLVCFEFERCWGVQSPSKVFFFVCFCRQEMALPFCFLWALFGSKCELYITQIWEIINCTMWHHFPFNISSDHSNGTQT